MSSPSIAAIAPPTRSARDFFAELVRHTQPQHGFLEAREAWLRSVQVEGREELLFEFEMLLRGIERYFNLHNLPLDQDNPPVVTRDFKPELLDVRDALDQAIRLARRLLDPGADQKMLFRRYVESQLLSDDRARRELLEQALDQDTPQEALFVLRQSFDSLRVVIDQLARLESCSYAVFTEVGNLALREIVLNRFFRPFRPLEFRLEYDRIRSVQLLELLARAPDAERRFFTTALLGLFRLLHYLSYVGDADRARDPRTRVVLALVRSESATLVTHLRGEAVAGLSEKRTQAGALKIARDIARAVEEIIGGLFEGDGAAGAQLKAAVAFTELFRKQIAVVARALDPALGGEDLFARLVSTADKSLRLRQDLWVLSDLCRSAQAAFALDETGDASMDALAYLREFVGYFHEVGYQLLRYGDFEAFDRFAEQITSLELPPSQPGARARLAEECRLFAQVSETIFTHVSRRADLAGRRFDLTQAERLLARFRPLD